MSADEELESESSSEDEKIVEKELNAKVQKLILEAEANPFQYDKHIELIKALRSSSDLDQLRNARENMSTIYPLSEDLWLEWIEDELPLAVIPEQKEYLTSKFELAVKDYASTKIWQQYCQFVMTNIEAPSDIEKARSIFERAITAVGLHVSEGSCIWDGYRMFEMDILDSYEQLQDSGDTIGMDEKVESSIEKVTSLFKRQLAIPLIGISDLYSSFENWSSEPIQGETIRAFEKASDKLELCLQFEEKLKSSDNANTLPHYYEYIHFEMKDGDPVRVQSIYERAIKDHCLQHELWEKYTAYLDNKLKIPSIAVNVHERAVRNCPWISKLWQNYIKAMERNNEDYEKIQDVVNQSLKGGFADPESYLNIWVLNIDYHRRKVTDWNVGDNKVQDLQNVFEKAVTYMNHHFRLEGDRYCILLREMAFIEAKYLQNPKKAQELWETVMKKHSRDINIWMEYINFLKLHCDISSVRRAFQRAVQISFDQPELLCNVFIEFERRYGDLKSLDDAQVKVDQQLQKAMERKRKEGIRMNEQSNNNEKRFEINGRRGKNKFESNEDKKRSKHKINKQIKDLKRAAMSDEKRVPSKKAKGNQEIKSNNQDRIAFISEMDKPQSNKEIETRGNPLSSNDKTNVSQTTAKVSTNSEDKANEERLMEIVGPSENNEIHKTESKDPMNNLPTDNELHIEKVDNERSIFLSNMLFTVEKSHIEEMFKKCGEIETVRIVCNRAGKSKGYAYLQFKEKNSIEKALSLDREGLLGRPVFVSPCVDKKENPTQFKFPMSLDKKTLYVTNIPFELTTEELSKIFEECGALKQVRIVTNRSGKSKGFAYVEYENEADAAKALVKLDQKMVNSRAINVALSNPPPRKVKIADGSTETTKPKVQEQTLSRGKSKTQISLLPRTLQKASLLPKSTAAEKSQAESTQETITMESDSDKSEQLSKLSNDDFRKFLLKK